MGPLSSGERLRALANDRSGAAALEAALVMPMILISSAGLIDGSRALIQSMQVRAAAHAGAEWAREYGWNAAGIQDAVVNSTTATVTASPAPVQFYGCATASSGVQTSVKGAKCSGDPVGKYVTVTATSSFATWAPWPGMDWPSTISSTAVVRVD